MTWPRLTQTFCGNLSCVDLITHSISLGSMANARTVRTFPRASSATAVDRAT